MKKGLVIVNGYYRNRNNEYKIQRLAEEFLPFGIELEVKDAFAMLPFCSGDKIDLDLSAYSFAVDMDKDMYLAKAISCSLPMFNGYESFVLSDDKMLSLLALKDSGVRAPLTVSAPLCYVTDLKQEQMDVFLNQVEEKLGYPMVFKECHGSLGKQVELIRNRKELNEIERKYCSTQHLYEQFLSLHQGHDYRLIVIGNQVIACMERRNEHDFRSNIALGGIGRDVTSSLGQEYRDLALKAAKALKLDYAGIDVGTDNQNHPVFIEANGNAFFTEVEKVTHINIAKALVEHIVKKLEKLEL